MSAKRMPSRNRRRNRRRHDAKPQAVPPKPRARWRRTALVALAFTAAVCAAVVKLIAK